MFNSPRWKYIVCLIQRYFCFRSVLPFTRPTLQILPCDVRLEDGRDVLGGELARLEHREKRSLAASTVANDHQFVPGHEKKEKRTALRVESL